MGRRASFALILVNALATNAYADEAPWDLKSFECYAPPRCDEASCCTRSLTVWSRPHAESKLREVRAVGEVDAPPDVVFGVVTDFEHGAEFMPHLEASTIVWRVGDDVLNWAMVDFPIAKRRDWVVRFHLEHPGADGTWRARWQTVRDGSGPPPSSRAIRVPQNDGAWTIEPLDGGRRSRATYQVVVDIGGWIPTWIANREQVKAVPDLFEAVAKRAQVLLAAARSPR